MDFLKSGALNLVPKILNDSEDNSEDEEDDSLVHRLQNRISALRVQLFCSTVFRKCSVSAQTTYMESTTNFQLKTFK